MIAGIQRRLKVGRGSAGAVSVAVALGMTGCGPASGGSVGEPATPAPLHASPAGTVLAIGQKPEGITVDPATGLVAVATRSPDAIVILDQRGTVIHRTSVTSSARHLRATPAGGILLIPAERAQRLIGLRLPDGDVALDLAVGRQPHDVVSAGRRIFVTNEFSDSVSVIEGARVTATVPAPRQPGGIAADGSVVAVIGVRAHILQTFDAESLQPLATVAAGRGPTHIVGGGGRFYVADTIGNAILVYSGGASLSLVARISAIGTPYGIALDSTRGRLWVTLTGRNVIEEYQLTDGGLTAIAEFPTPRSPNSVAVDIATGTVYVTGTADGVVQILNPRTVRG